MKRINAVSAAAWWLMTVSSTALAGNPDGMGPVSAKTPEWAWPNGRFVYQLSPKVAGDPARAAAFAAACADLVAGSALQCIPREDPSARDDADYVYVISGPGNHSVIGRQGGRQVLSINAWNNRIKIAHEIKHALGWPHEHQHPHRDRYVEILFENIPPAWHPHFQVRDFGNEGPYDFDSVMHYYPTDLAWPARTAIRAQASYRHLESRMGQRSRLSDTDRNEICAVYGAAEGHVCGLNALSDEGGDDREPADNAWVLDGH